MSKLVKPKPKKGLSLFINAPHITYPKERPLINSLERLKKGEGKRGKNFETPPLGVFFISA